MLRRKHWSIQGGGGVKNPLFLVSKKADIFFYGGGVKIYNFVNLVYLTPGAP